MIEDSAARTCEAIALEEAFARYFVAAAELELAYHAWKETEG